MSFAGSKPELDGPPGYCCLWQRLQRTRLPIKTLHLGHRLSFLAIFAFVRGRNTMLRSPKDNLFCRVRKTYRLGSRRGKSILWLANRQWPLRCYFGGLTSRLWDLQA